MNNDNTTNENREVEMTLKDKIRIETEQLREDMVPELKEVIQLYEKGEISLEEARQRVESIRKKYGSEE